MRQLFFVLIPLVLLAAFSEPAYASDPLTPEERVWLAAHDGKIKLAPVPNYPPIDFIDADGRPAGLSQDYIRLIEERLGFRFQIVRLDKFPNLIEKLKNREVDATTTVSLMEERKAFLDFQEPHYRTEKVIITQQKAKGVGGLTDLTGRSLALVVGYEYSKRIREKYPDIRVIPVKDEPAGIEAVAFGRVDAFVGDLASASHNIERLGITNLKVAAGTEYAFDLRMASRNDWPVLTGILAKGLALVTEQERNSIHQRWIHLHRPEVFYETREFWVDVFLAVFAALLIVSGSFIWRSQLRRRVQEQTRQLRDQLGETTRITEILRKSELRFAMSMEATNDGIWDWDVASDETYFSPAYYRMLGYAPDEFPASVTAWSELLHPEDRERSVAMAMSCVDGAVERFDVEFRLRAKDGHWHWILGRGKCVSRGADGRALRLIGTHMDIDERKKREQERAVQEEKYQRLVESTNTVPWELDLSTGTFTYMGLQIERITGYQVSEWTDMASWAATILPEDRDHAVSFCQDQTAKGLDHDFVYRMLTKDGRVVWIHDIVSVVQGADGPETLVGFMHDITAAREAEEKRAASERRFRSLFENMTEGFALHEIVLDDAGRPVDYRWLDVNPAFERETGLQKEAVVQSTFRSLMPDEDSFWLETYGKVALGGPPVHLTHYSAALKKHYEIYSYSPEHLKFAVLFRDVTEKAALEEKLQQSQKMEAIGTLAGGIAHDFNNILGAIIGYTELSLGALPAGSEVRENLQEVMAASARAKELVGQILAFSRRDKKRRMPVDVHRVVSEAMKLLSSVMPKTVSIDQRLDVAAGHVLADPTELHQVVMNLCTNAYQAMSQQESGNLRIVLCSVSFGAREAAANPELATGDYVRLDVEDDGPGMDEATMARIFEPYFTTKEHGKGTGLGLALVHGIATSLGGTVTVRSTSGAGTAFSVYLPVAPATDATVSVVEDQSESRGTENVLLVDDEPAMAKLGRKILESLGYTVREATDPLEALRIFESDPTGFDLIVTDQTMPGLTGAELIRQAKATRPEMPAVICTGYSDLIDEASAKEQGISAFVQKPYDRNQLSDAVVGALGKEG